MALEYQDSKAFVQKIMFSEKVQEANYVVAELFPGKKNSYSW